MRGARIGRDGRGRFATGNLGRPLGAAGKQSAAVRFSAARDHLRALKQDVLDSGAFDAARASLTERQLGALRSLLFVDCFAMVADVDVKRLTEWAKKVKRPRP